MSIDNNCLHDHDQRKCEFNIEDTQSNFSSHSMSSSMIKRNERLTFIDTKFKQVSHTFF